MSHNHKRQRVLVVEEEEDDEDEDACERFLYRKRRPSSSPNPLDTRLRLEYELLRTFSCMHLQLDADLSISVASRYSTNSEYYYPVLRGIDLVHHRTCYWWRLLSHRRQAEDEELAPFPSAAQLAPMAPFRRERTLQQMEIEASLVRASTILRHLLLDPSKQTQEADISSLRRAVELVERAAMTLTKVAFVMRAATLALAQHLRTADTILSRDAERLACVAPAPPLQPLARRHHSFYRIMQKGGLLLPDEVKSEARLAFEDAVIDVLDWRIARARDEIHADGYVDVMTLMVSVTGQRSSLPHQDHNRPPSDPGTINLTYVTGRMVNLPRTRSARDGELDEVMTLALMIARGMEEAGHALLRAAQLLRASGVT